MVIIGDLNVDYGADSQARQRLISMLSAIGAEQLVTSPTRKEKSILDQVITDSRRVISTEVSCELDSRNGKASDHKLIRFSLRGRPPPRTKNTRIIWLIKRANWVEINQRLLEANLVQSVLSAPSIDLACEALTSSINKILTELIPRKCVRTDRSEDWMTSELLALILRKNELYQIWKRSGSKQDEILFKSLRSQCKRLVRQASLSRRHFRMLRLRGSSGRRFVVFLQKTGLCLR